MHEIIIVEPSPEDVTLQQAAAIAGCNAKTLRRAVQAGRLPRHYLMSPHGPQLVFQRCEVDGWVAQRHPDRPAARGRVAPAPGSATAWPELPELLAGLHARLGESQAMIAQLYARIEDQDRLIDRAQSTIAALTRSLQQHDAVDAAAPTSAGGDEDLRRMAEADRPGVPRANAAGTRPA